MPFGIYIIWKESFITGPGTFQADKGFPNLYIWLMRADPTEPGWYRYAEVNEGSIPFTQVGYQSGDTLEGRFEQLSLYDWDAETHTEVDNGTFCCRVE